MKIITLTLNPAFDLHCSVPNFAPYHENPAEITANDAGGKGINISRALTVNGVDNLAFVLLGDENGDSFARALQADGIRYRQLTVKGRIRENITCHTEGVPETRISFKGFTVNEALLDQAYLLLEDALCGECVVTLTGSVPSGLDMGAVKAFLRRFTDRGARIVIDSRSFGLDDLREMKPWLIKPNQEEISAYLGREITRFDEMLSALEALHTDGIANVMVSMGSDGAMLVSDEGVFIASPPSIKVISTIGAGDSSIAGFLAAAKNGASAEECLCTAVAYGTAACMTEGTKPPRPSDVEALRPLVVVKKVN